MSVKQQIKRTLGTFLLVLCIIVLTTPHAFAAPANVFPDGMEQVIGKAMAQAISILNVFAWILFIFLNYLLDPNFIFNIDKSGNFLNMLNEIWQLSRDLVNIFFALALIAAAIYTVVTQNKELVTSHLKNFVIAVVLVNFSWFFPRVILDVANVATSTVYGIPSLITSALGDGGKAVKCMVEEKPTNMRVGCIDPPDADTPMYCPCQGVVDAEFFVDKKDIGAGRKFDRAQGWQCNDVVLCLKWIDLDVTAVAGHSAMLNGLIVNHAHLRTLALVPPPVKAGTVSEMIIFLIREAIILVIHIALVFPLLAMVVAFAIRIPVLWITMAFMPFFFIGKIGGDKLGFVGETANKIGNTFLKAAFLPAMVAVPFTIGFIMINAGSQLPDPGLGSMGIRLLDNVNGIWSLLWLCMSLGIVWWGVFKVLENADVMGKYSQNIKAFGQQLGGLALRAPLAAPILPGGGTPLAAMNLLKDAPRGMNALLDSGKSLPAAFKDLTTKGAALDDRNRFVQKVTTDDGARRTFENKIDALKTAIERGPGNKTQADQLIKDINRDHKLNLNTDSTQIHTDLHNLAEEMRKKKDGTQTNTKNFADAIARANRVNNPPTTAPAAPPPAVGAPPPAAPPAPAGGP